MYKTITRLCSLLGQVRVATDFHVQLQTKQLTVVQPSSEVHVLNNIWNRRFILERREIIRRWCSWRTQTITVGSCRALPCCQVILCCDNKPLVQNTPPDRWYIFLLLSQNIPLCRPAQEYVSACNTQKRHLKCISASMDTVESLFVMFTGHLQKFWRLSQSFFLIHTHHGESNLR